MNRQLSILEVTRAIYIDFEKTVNGPPVILGSLCEQDFVQAIVAQVFRPAAHAKNLPYCDLHQRILELINLAEEETRVIVAWSTHDWNVVKDSVKDDSLVERFANCYVNAIPTARRYKQRLCPDLWFPRNALADYLRVTRYPVPHVGHQKVASQIRHVESQLTRHHGDYSALSPVAKAKWTKALKHNEADLRGMRHVLEIAKCLNETQ